MSPDAIRTRLLSLSAEFGDTRTPHGHPGPDLCRADEFPDAWNHLMYGWNRCLAAADIIDARYRADWSGDGPLAILAETTGI